MQVNMQEFLDAVSQVSEIAVGKNIPGVMLDIGNDKVRVCYTDSNTVSLLTEISALVTNDDPHGQIVFDYDPLIRVLDACKTTGKIQTDVLNINFNNEGTCTLVAERYIEMEVPKKQQGIASNIAVENSNEGCSDMTPSPVIASEVADINDTTDATESNFDVVRQLVSTIEQVLNWYIPTSPRALVRQRALIRGRYEAMLHLDEEEIDAYKERLISSGMQAENIPANTLPIETSHWKEVRDTWDINELQTIFSRLSVDTNQMLYISPSASKAFVVTSTKGIYSVDLNSDIQNKIIITTNMAKSIASILSRLRSKGYRDIYVHTDNIIEGSKARDEAEIIFSVDDNSFALRVKRQRQEESATIMADNSIGADYSQYTMMFNKDAFLSVINGAKALSASDSAKFKFELVPGDDVMVAGSKNIKLVASVTNTNKSADNRYDINAAYAIDQSNNLESVTFSGNILLISNIVSKMTSDFIAFDMNEIDGSKYRIRLSEIDENKRALLCENYQLDGMGTEEIVKYRNDYLGFSTYFNVSKG